MPQFASVGLALGAAAGGDARGMSVADFDNDGDLDIVVNHNPGDCGCESVPAVLLRNDLGHKRNWFALDLTGTKSNRDAVGTVVTLELAPSDEGPAPKQLMRHVNIGGGYASQNGARLYFGLGAATRIESMVVQWPSGLRQTFKDLRAQQIYRLTEGSTPNSVAGSGRSSKVQGAAD